MSKGALKTLALTLATMMKSMGASATPGTDGKPPEQLEAEEAAAAAAAAGATPGSTGAAPLAKSITGTLADGTPFEGIDGAELIESLSKSMTTRVEEGEAQTAELLSSAVALIGAQTAQIGELQKSLGETTTLVGQLRADLDQLRNEPGGRKTVTTPQGGDPLNKSLDNNGAAGGQLEGMKPREFLAKCLSMHKSGALSLQDVTMAEAAINSKMEVPADIRSKVFASK